MDLFQTILLAIIQGLTEFLPISSSGHLILLPHFMAWKDQGLAFDVAVHVGTLIAVVAYFRRELRCMSAAWFSSLRGGEITDDARLAWWVLVGTIPAGIAGLLLSQTVAQDFRNPWLIAAATAGFGLLLWWADARGRRERDEYSLSLRDVLIIGAAQALALIPGTSRSGITMTAALMLGVSRQGAARFSFLLSIPVIALAGGQQTSVLLQAGAPVHWHYLIIGIGVSAVSAYMCIRWFLGMLRLIGMAPFAIYRLILAAVTVLTIWT